MAGSGMHGSGAERRRHRRHPIQLDARLRSAGQEARRCVILDFSSRGILLSYDLAMRESASSAGSASIELGERVEVAFKLPPEGTDVMARAKVVRHMTDGAMALVGALFGPCNAIVLDQLIRLSRETIASGLLEVPAHDRLVRDVYATLLSRVESEDGTEHASYFYALMALKGHEERIRAYLAQLLAREPGPPFDVSLLSQPFRAAFSELSIAAPARELIESVLADVAERSRSATGAA
jgi:hypothetical protein